MDKPKDFVFNNFVRSPIYEYDDISMTSTPLDHYFLNIGFKRID
ncbi:hypothetical protein BSBH6_00175 [Bacillus subtilis]|nr:hypothetical protein BSBH6_00175 [Bacillus subtilis]RPK26538.1 hypothetical protein BH5_00173 [Bacillus subtilis]